MKVIGFANQFFTLWDVWSEKTYFTDSYGNHWVTGEIVHNCYIKNVSIDKEKAFELHPDARFDEGLRGKSRSWDDTRVDDTTPPNILNFGKYCGQDIAEVVKTDMGYLLWVLDNAGKKPTKDAIRELPEIIQYFAEREAERKRIQDALPVLESGEVEITFLTNPNRNEGEYGIIHELCKFKYPETLTWVECADADNSNPDAQVKRLFKASSNTSGYEYVVGMWKESEDICLNSHTLHIKTVDDAKQQAELQELVNKGKSVGDYVVPSEISALRGKYYSEATIGDGNVLYFFFPEIKAVGGMYPYNMAIINGKAQKVKGKKLKLNVKVLNTEKLDTCVYQVVVVNEMSCTSKNGCISPMHSEYFKDCVGCSKYKKQTVL